MSEPATPDANMSEASQLTRSLELELIQIRAGFEQTKHRNQSLRSAAFLFLFLIIAGCMVGFFFTFVWVNEHKADAPHATLSH
jgi:hypothetical protein